MMPIREFLDRWFAAHPLERALAALAVANGRLVERDAEIARLRGIVVDLHLELHEKSACRPG